MRFGVVVLFVVPAILIFAGVLIIRWALGRARERPTARAVVVLRCLGGVGTMLLTGVALGWLFSDAQYGVLLMPVLAIVLAIAWNAILLGAAALVDWVHRRRHPEF
ncbi:hypothetical protein [Schumannella sp. 10F1B-5-1]|uniref:hypothetical protein n=1 Tax=Schumannella sp. 10F1B-5-1 TaxID=2590780 RepID=UPI0011317954|nr:hypothetical protein [Schumannella sp. 10F1B-5-1]TPW70902.1 hypothetical protein FJ658_12410 [Schumannella sp. 10F1B-5-1]